MNFLAPLMLIGAAGLALPVIIHLIGRSRARVVRFAALDFLLASRRKTARRLRLRERLLLLIRALVCLAIPLALAKPYTSCASKGPEVSRGPQAAVLVIDDSFAAGYELDGRSLLAREIEEAKRILTRLGPEAEVAVVRIAEGSDVPGELTRDHLRIRDTLAGLTPTARPADLSTALGRAAHLLTGSSHIRRTVYVLSVLARTGLRSTEAPWGPDGPALAVVDVRGGRALPNRAVTRVSVEPEPGTVSRGIAITAEIANFSPEPAIGVGVALRLAGTVVARGTIDLRPGERAIKRFLAALPEGERAADAIIELDGDALGLDDRRWARTRLRQELRVLLVDGDPRTVRHDDELFYLEAALRPGDRSDAGAALTKITVDDLGDVDLGGFDVVVLANVPALVADRVAGLHAWVQAGGGMWVTVGDNVDAAAYEKTMLPLLPQSLRDPIDTTYGADAAERASRALRLSKWDYDHPIFQPFGKDAPELTAATFAKVTLLGPTTDVADRKVLARYTNGAVALIEASSGQGRLLLSTSTIDRDWNDLAIHPGYLPLAQQALRHLARTADRRVGDDNLVGRSVLLPVDDMRKLEIRGPGRRDASFEGERLANRTVVRFGETELPGVYRIIGTDGTGATSERGELAFAVNLDPRGSDLTAADPSMLPKSGSGTGPGRDPGERRLELWHAVGAALLILLLLESILIQRPT